MAAPPPPTPTPPTHQPGTGAAIHASGITGVVTLALLLVLNSTVFQNNTPPADVGYVLSPAVSYVVSLAAGYLTRWRLRHPHVAHEPPGEPVAAPLPGPGPEQP